MQLLMLIHACLLCHHVHFGRLITFQGSSLRSGEETLRDSAGAPVVWPSHCTRYPARTACDIRIFTASAKQRSRSIFTSSMPNEFYEEISFRASTATTVDLFTYLPYVMGSAAAPFAKGCGLEDNRCAGVRLLATGEAHLYTWANDDMCGMRDAVMLCWVGEVS